MIDKDILRWFMRGFIFTSLLLLTVVVIIMPAISWAQGGGDEKPKSQRDWAGDTPSQTLSSDDPLGRAPATVPDAGALRANQQRSEVNDVSHTVRSDDPLGRVVAEVANSYAALSNRELRLRGDTPSSDLRSDKSTQPSAGVEAAEDVSGQSFSSPLIIPASDFTDDGDFTNYSFSFNGGYVAGGFACMQAPAYLPNGAVIDEIFASVYDNNPSGFVDPFLWRVENFTGASNILASVSTTPGGASTAIQVLNDTTVNTPLVSYPDYSYYVTVCLDPNTRLYSVRIYYSGP